MKNQITKVYPFIYSDELAQKIRRCMSNLQHVTNARFETNMASKRAGEVFELKVVCSPFDICLVQAYLSPFV